MIGYSYFPQTVPTDDARKSSISRTVLTYSIPDLHNTEKEEDLTESTSVVPAKYSLKVKLETLHNFRVPELGEVMRTLVCEGFEVFIVALS